MNKSSSGERTTDHALASRPQAPRPRVTLLYHFFHPDDVVSARLYSELAAELAGRGWDVVARPANRVCHEQGPRLPTSEQWQGVDIRRVRRPDFRQASNRGRLLNTAWMLAGWSWAALFARRPPQEAVLIGTDPILGVLAAMPWTLFRRRTKVIHWCFDLYPDAAVADGLLEPGSRLVRLLRRLTAAALRRCDFVADLGACMGRRLTVIEPGCRPETITPWSLVEPPAPPAPDPQVRCELFGAAALGLLYSGSFGRAHSGDEFLALARALRGGDAAFCFAGRGNRVDELRRAVEADDGNIRFAGFAPEEQLEKRLTACDLHLVSLRPEWTGAVVPSKLFGALAAGRGVVFAGSPDSAIAGWIREHQVGWVLTRATIDEVAAHLRQLAADPARLAELKQRCHAVYHAHFSKRMMIERWDAQLRRLLGEGAATAS
ncbi:MAG: glycosyltransferase family 4 protein [Planctomycetales bacterium]|nr:glycosyltransferase family 4 protein [Planctomycetales bacterium]